MANLVGTSIAKNFERALMDTMFGTRQISYYVVSLSGVDTNFWNPGSTFAKAVQGIQSVAEIYALGYPQSGAFTVAVAFNTAAGSVPAYSTPFVWGATPSNPSGPADVSGTNSVLEDAIDAATGGSSTVYYANFRGDNFVYDC